MRRLLTLALLLSAGCAPRAADVVDMDLGEPVSVPGVPMENTEAAAVLNGTVTGGTTLPEGAVVTVRVEDVSLADAPSAVLAEQIIRPVREFPIVFSLSYAPARVDVRRRYAVRATVRDAAGALLWTTTTTTPVFTQGAPIDGVEVPVERVAD